MKIIKGRDFILSINKDGVPTPVCYSTDFTINRERATKEISGPQSIDRDYLPSYKGYTIGISGVVSYIDGFSFLDLEEAFDKGTRLEWVGTDSENGGIIHKGVVILTSLAWASPVRADFTFEAAAIGCGPKITIKQPISSTVYLSDENKVRLAGCSNPYPVSLYWYDASGNKGVFIGIAINSDDVINTFNNYIGNEYYQLTGATSGCDFNLLSAWDAPFVPTVIFSEPTPELGVWSGSGDEGVSPDQINDELLSPGYA